TTTVHPGILPQRGGGKRVGAADAGQLERPVRDRRIRSLREPDHLARDCPRHGQGGVGGGSARRGGGMVSTIRARPPASHALASGRLRGRPEGMRMPTVVLAAYNTAGFAQGGRHFWDSLHYALVMLYTAVVSA